jgi:hypothetical protein
MSLFGLTQLKVEEPRLVNEASGDSGGQGRFMTSVSKTFNDALSAIRGARADHAAERFEQERSQSMYAQPRMPGTTGKVGGAPLMAPVRQPIDNYAPKSYSFPATIDGIGSRNLCDRS